MNKKTFLISLISISALLFLAACAQDDGRNTTATSTVTPPPVQTLKGVPRPQKIVDLMSQRGEQDQGQPALKIVSPAEGAVLKTNTVSLRLNLSGDLKGYKPHKDPASGTGNHVHVILDNQPYEAYYEIDQPFELRNVVAGKHTIRVFPSRPWHESYKNDGAFQMETFTVDPAGDTAKPTTTA